MALIKKCATCSNKGFSLKLSDGLCPSCSKELKSIEHTYISALQKLSTSTYDKNEITNMIKSILLKLPKFAEIDCSVKLDDCITLLSNLDNTSPTTSNDTNSSLIDDADVINNDPILLPYSSGQPSVTLNSLEPISYTTSSEESIESLESLLASLGDNISKEVVNIPSTDYNEITENTLSPSQGDIICEYNDTDTSTDCNDDSNNSCNSDNIIDVKDNIHIVDNMNTIDNVVDVDSNPIVDIGIESNSLDISDNSNNVEVDMSISSNDIDNSSLWEETSEEQIESIKPFISEVEEVEPSASSIKNDLYIQTSKVIGILKNKHSSINDLAENLFLLKNTYLPVLKDNSIFEVDDINIENIIKDTLKLLTLRTNQKEENIYDFFNYVTFAIQTNGIRTKTNDILEISALKIRYGKIVDEFYTLINPLKSIDVNIQRSTGISNNAISDAPTFDIAIPDFINFTDGLKLISHNSKFMTAFLNNKYKILYGQDISNKVGCSMDLYRIRFRDYHGEPAKAVDISSCASDILSFEDFNKINSFDSIAVSTCYGTYELYEKLKYKYK